jgi:hypothetical protein
MTVLLDKSADIEKVKEEIANSLKTVEAQPEISSPTDTQVLSKTAEPTEAQAPEELPATAEGPAHKPKEPVDADPPQELESQANEGEAIASETKEEIK